MSEPGGKSTTQAAAETGFDFAGAGIACLLIAATALFVSGAAPVPQGALKLAVFSGMAYMAFRGIKKPEYLLYLLAAYLPFSKLLMGEAVISPVTSYLNLGLVTAAAVWFFLKRRSQNETFPFFAAPLALPWLVLLGIQAASIARGFLYGPDYLTGALAQWVQAWLTPALIYFLVCAGLKDKRQIRTMTAVMMTGITAVALLTIWKMWDFKAAKENWFGVDGFAADPYLAAAFLTNYMFLPLAFVFVYWRRIVFWPMLAPFAAAAAGAMMTLSRGAVFAIAAGCAAIAFFKNRLLFVVLLAAGIILAVVPLAGTGSLMPRMKETFGGKSFSIQALAAGNLHLDRSSSGRLQVWRGALRMTEQEPLFGIGFYRFEYQVPPFWSGAQHFRSHNVVLQALAETGLTGLAVFLWLMGAAFACARSLYRTTPDAFSRALSLGFLAGFVSLLVNNLFIVSLDWQEVWIYFWVLAGMLGRPGSGGRLPGTGDIA